jgi:hypothetical protein
VNVLDRTVVQPSVPAARRPGRFTSLPDSRADSTEILIWARALMVPGSNVILIDENNSGQGWCPLEEAVRSRRPFAIQVREDVLAIDADQPALLQKLLGLAAALRRDVLYPVVLRSGRPGHAHLWCQIAEPALRADYGRRAKALGFDVREESKLCRPPMAPHRHGRPLAVLGAHPETRHWQEALAEIGREQRRQEIEATWRRITHNPTWCLSSRTPVAAAAPTKPARARRRPLNPKWDRLVRNGVPEGQRHQAIQAVTLAAVNAGWTEADLFRVLIHNRLGEKVLEQRGEAAQRLYVSAAWQKAVARAVASPPVPGGPSVQAEVTRLREAVAAYPWKPRSGTTDRTVVEAHLDTIARTGKLEHDANVRDLGVATGLTWQCVSKAHQRLRTSRWLVPVTGAGQRGFATSTCWKVTYPGSQDCAVRATYATTPWVHEAYVNLTAQSHDAFRRHGLGKDTFRVWSRLDPMAPVKARALAQALNRSRRTVYDHLEKLQKFGLALKSPSGWLRAGVTTLNAVAETIGVAGVGDAQKMKHLLDRKTRKDKRAMMLKGTGTDRSRARPAPVPWRY